MTEHDLEKLKAIFIEIFQLIDADVEAYRKLNNSKWDSLASVTLMAAIESEFDIELREADYDSLTSFAAAELVLEKYLS